MPRLIVKLLTHKVSLIPYYVGIVLYNPRLKLNNGYIHT